MSTPRLHHVFFLLGDRNISFVALSATPWSSATPEYCSALLHHSHIHHSHPFHPFHPSHSSHPSSHCCGLHFHLSNFLTRSVNSTFFSGECLEDQHQMRPPIHWHGSERPRFFLLLHDLKIPKSCFALVRSLDQKDASCRHRPEDEKRQADEMRVVRSYCQMMTAAGLN